MKLVGGAHSESYWVYVAAGALAIGGPVWQYLYASHYPFWRVEAFVVPTVAALLGALVAAAGRRIGGVLGALVFGALIFAFVDLQFDLHVQLPTALILAGCLALPLVIRERRATLTTITLGALYVASVPRIGTDDPGTPRERSRASTPTLATPAVTSAKSLPLLVHVILDEHWGIGGLRAEGEEASADRLTRFYLDRGFETYEAAYSHSFSTKLSIPNALSNGNAPVLRSPDASSTTASSLQVIPYFDSLRARGYSIRVYQTSFIDLCHAETAAVSWCETQSGNSVANIGRIRGSWLNRALLVSRYVVQIRSHLARVLRPTRTDQVRSSVGGGILVMERVRHAVEAGLPQNTALFVHVLLPHTPLEVNAKCEALPFRAWLLSDPSQAPPDSSDATWRKRLAVVSGQIGCAELMVDELISAVDRTVGRDNSIILVHGDHGARREQGARFRGPLSSYGGRVLNSRFSTLLAIRRPGRPAKLHAEPVPVQDFVWELTRRGFDEPFSRPWPQYVRVSPTDTEKADTLRSLTAKEMPWVRSPQ